MDPLQLDKLTASWPPELRKATYAVHNQLICVGWLHSGLLGRAKPRHALFWMERLADHEWGVEADGQAVAAASNNQPFVWGDQNFTCAHRAVLSLANDIASLIAKAKSPHAIHVINLPETSGKEEWKAAYIRQAQKLGLLDEQRCAGREWTAFCDRYREQAGEVAWDYKTSSTLLTALLLEANGAVPLWEIAHLPKQRVPPVQPPIDPCLNGIAILTTTSLAKKTISITKLAAQMGVHRSDLYGKDEFAPLRKIGSSLFNLFKVRPKKGDVNLPRGSKDKQGRVEGSMDKLRRPKADDSDE